MFTRMLSTKTSITLVLLQGTRLGRRGQWTERAQLYTPVFAGAQATRAPHSEGVPPDVVDSGIYLVHDVPFHSERAGEGVAGTGRPNEVAHPELPRNHAYVVCAEVLVRLV